MNLHLNADAYAVGSLPHQKVATALKLFTKDSRFISHAPELPNLSKSEFLMNQDFETELHSFAEALENAKSSKSKIFKIQLCGPLTRFGFHPKKSELARIKKHALNLIRIIKAENLTPLLVFDEPVLDDSKISSVKILKKLVAELKEESFIGIHSCNRVSPKLLISTGADLINFDLTLCVDLIYESRDELRDYIRNGGSIVWGLVPTNLQKKNAAKMLADALIDIITALNSFGVSIEKTLTQSAISPTCGLALLTETQASAVLKTTSMVCNILKLRYKLSDHATINN